MNLELGTSKQGGWRKQGSVPKRRPRRSYSSERPLQVLKHLATILFFWVKQKVSETQEVQIMYAKGNLFIATNADAEALKLLKLLNLKSALQMYGGKYSKMGKVSLRHSEKLKGLISGSRKYSETKGIAKILAEANDTLSAFQITLKKKSIDTAFAGTGKIYVLLGEEDGRHAEEKLMDLLELSGSKENVVLAGKKRPCGTCLGRIENVRSKGYSITAGANPGLVWKQRFEAQSSEVQRSTVDVVKSKDQFVSEIGQGYASESDSEAE